MVILLTTWVVVKLEKKDEVKLAFIFCTHRWQIDTPPPPPPPSTHFFSFQSTNHSAFFSFLRNI